MRIAPPWSLGAASTSCDANDWGRDACRWLQHSVRDATKSDAEYGTEEGRGETGSRRTDTRHDKVKEHARRATGAE